jgi:hypothetical protein
VILHWKKKKKKMLERYRPRESQSVMMSPTNHRTFLLYVLTSEIYTPLIAVLGNCLGGFTAIVERRFVPAALRPPATSRSRSSRLPHKSHFPLFPETALAVLTPSTSGPCYFCFFVVVMEGTLLSPLGYITVVICSGSSFITTPLFGYAAPCNLFAQQHITNIFEATS